MSEGEVHALFDRLFPRGFAGQDVLDEIAPEGWERSPLLACFHPSVERVYENACRCTATWKNCAVCVVGDGSATETPRRTRGSERACPGEGHGS
jgi:hypothetical protein